MPIPSQNEHIQGTPSISLPSRRAEIIKNFLKTSKGRGWGNAEDPSPMVEDTSEITDDTAEWRVIFK